MKNYKSRYPYRLWLPGLLLLSVIWLHANPSLGAGSNPGPQLVVSHFSTSKVIASLNVKNGDHFTIRYIHSVDKTPIFEEFRLDRKKGLVLEKTWFTMFGAGLGHWPGHGNLSQNSEWITIDNIEQPLGSFILRIGSPSVGHTIIYHEQEINLSRLAPGARALVEFRNR
ncbi:MAG: DUF1850 domain-containing protein [Deltaproteobacteria bacterium]|nr:DUF1850 domain-containing protein [Candidatus Tharpella aukensis]